MHVIVNVLKQIHFVNERSDPFWLTQLKSVTSFFCFVTKSLPLVTIIVEVSSTNYVTIEQPPKLPSTESWHCIPKGGWRDCIKGTELLTIIGKYIFSFRDID